MKYIISKLWSKITIIC